MDTPAFIVFGATGGIGRALSQKLSSKGCRLLLAARQEEKLASLAGELNAEMMSVDATDPSQVDACFQRAKELFERIDGVAHCVGSILLKPAHLTSNEEWDQTIDLNLNSAFYVVRSAARAMMKTGGSVVLMSSCAARVGLTNHEAIAAAKAGVIGLTLSAAATYAPRGIRVNCVAPGLVRTPMSADVVNNESSLKMSEAMHPIGRIGEPADVASAMEWFLDPQQSWITGQVLGVDGGLGTVRPRPRK